MTHAERIAELRMKMEHYHEKAKHAADLEERNVYAGIANEVSREIVLVLAAIHSPKPKKGR